MRNSGRFVVGLISLALAGCTAFDPLDQRGETVNRSAAEYANNAMLLNIARAKRQEPLTFITITGVGGTDSVGGSLGLPAIGLGPTAVTSPRNYLFGPNSLSRSNGNSFQFAVVDDPGSFAGLMAPVNPAVIAYLMRQGYPRPLLFFLLTEELRETNKRTGVTKRYVNEPGDPTYGAFIGKMASLLLAGLVAQVDATAFPSGKVLPASRLCFDPLAPEPWTALGEFKSVSRFAVPAPPVAGKASCDNADWIEADVAVPTATGGSGGGGPTSLGVSQDGSLWTMLSPTQFLRIGPGGEQVAVKIPKDLLPRPKKTLSHIVTFSFEDASGNRYEIYLRSTLGAYSYIGAYSAQPIDNLLPVDGAGSGSMIDLVEGQTVDCFAQVDYRGIHYCVPEAAGNSKKLMTVLHLLQQLQTAPSNVPTTLTVTPIP